jgi:hypothetical protein
MRCEPWMYRDERTPEQIKRDRIRSLQHEKGELERRLDRVRHDLAELGVGSPS